MSLLKQDTTRKKWVDKVTFKLEFDEGNRKSEEYKVKAIYNSHIYAKELEDHLPGVYCLVLCKNHPEEKNTWKPVLTIQHLQRLITTFHKEHLEKSTATFLPVDSDPSMARHMIKLNKTSSTKQKPGRPAKESGVNKHTKKTWTFDFHLVFSSVSLAGKVLPQSPTYRFILPLLDFTPFSFFS